jgi:hypothetical protein
MSSIRVSTFLRRVLLLDAVSCGAMAVLLLAGSGLLAGALGLPAELLNEAGSVLLPFALVLAVAGTRSRLPRPVVWAVIVANSVWVIDSFVLLFSGWVSPSWLGWVFVAGQAAFVAVLAELEFIGLRKSAAVATPAHP